MTRSKDKLAAKWEERIDLAWEEDGPPLPGQLVDPEVRERWDAWFREKDQEDREQLEKAVLANAQELRGKGHDNVVDGSDCRLDRVNPEGTMVAIPWTHVPDWRRTELHPAATHRVGAAPRLTVTGLGPYTGQRKARRAVIDLASYDRSNRPVERIGITCDGSLTLPDIAARVYVRLRDLKRTATVSLDRCNKVFRGDEPPPPDWLIVQQWKPAQGEQDDE
jgi:hypothetical protein